VGDGQDLVDNLRLEEVGPHRYLAHNDGVSERGVVFGGQLLAQLSVAAAKADESKTIKSTQGVFSRTVLSTEPAEIDVDVFHVGRVFATATATMSQRGRQCARAQVLLTSYEEDLIRHAAPMPDVPGPEDSGPWDDQFRRELRMVDNVDINDATVVGPPEMYAWLRVPTAPDEQVIGQALLAHASASFLIGTAMRPHEGMGQSITHKQISSGIISHTVSFHEPFDVRDWLLMAMESPYAGRGRTYGVGRVFTRDGELVASFSQENMIRHLPEGHVVAGRESTIL
jgi:acyl-CoA thioesterase II